MNFGALPAATSFGVPPTTPTVAKVESSESSAEDYVRILKLDEEEAEAIEEEIDLARTAWIQAVGESEVFVLKFANSQKSINY